MAITRWYETPPGTVQTDFRGWEGTPPVQDPRPTESSSLGRDLALFAVGFVILVLLVSLVFRFLA